MAKGGSMKGHMQSHNNGSRGRTTYAVLVLLAFGVAIFGLVILHKLRERRMFNLLVKDKETQLIHLQLLLQKEREHTKEAKRKQEEMKSKMQWVRMQKRDLESRILEMKSIISSLKEEQRIIEATLEEKQDEINTLREKLTETNRDDFQVKLLSESLQQKEAENDIPIKVWSVSADDPSNPTTNFTTNAAGRKEADGGETEELRETHERDDQKNTTENIHRNVDESALKQDEAATRQGEDRGQAQDGEGSTDWESNTGEQESQELRTVQGDVPGDISSTIFQTLDVKRETNDSKAGEKFIEEKRYDNGNALEESINHSGQVQKQSKEVGIVDATDWKEHGTAIGGDQGNFGDSQGNNQESGGSYESGLKLDMKENHRGTDASRVKQEHIRKTKGKSRRIIAESKVAQSGMNIEKRSIVSMRNRKFFKHMQESETNERNGGSKQEIQDLEQEKNMDPDSRTESGKDPRIDMTYKTQQFKVQEELDMRQTMQDESSDLYDPPVHKTLPNTMKSAGTKEGIPEGRKSDTNEITGKGQEIEANNTESEMSWSSQEVPIKTAASKVKRVSKDSRNKKSDETTKPQEAVGISRERQEQKQADNLPNASEHAHIAGRDVKADDLQVENDQETEGEIHQSRNFTRGRISKPQ